MMTPEALVSDAPDLAQPGRAMDAMTDFIGSTTTEFEKLKQLAEKALAQVDDAAFFHAPDAESNSLAVLVKHLGGNLASRWTDFLTTDGEKPTRDRDAEFELRSDSRAALMRSWEQGWGAVLGSMRALRPADLGTTVHIRGEALTAVAAAQRSLSHTASHVGQIVWIAKHLSAGAWQNLSVPRGKSKEFNSAVQTQAQGNARA
jgi:hypothetical protein